MGSLKADGLDPNTLLPDSLGLIFQMPVPPSWSKRKKASHIGTPHRQKPDIDNLIKAFLDTIYGSHNPQSNGDQHHWDIRGVKVWVEEGEGAIVILRLEPLGHILGE